MSGSSGTLRLSLLIEAVDRASAPLERLRTRMSGVAAGILRAGQAAQRLGNATGATILAGSIATVATRAREATSAIAGLAGRLALLGAGGAYVFNQQFVRGAADFERYRITLETVMGSADAAQRRLAELTEFAARTPFNVAEVVQAGVALQTLGIRGAAADRALTAVGDAAAIFGTSLNEAMTAFNATLRGEMDPIERFGIQARTEGERIVMQWEENGRRMRATVDKNNRAAIAAVTSRALRGIAGGGMQRLSESWDGMVSNLGDAWQNFARRVAENGPFDWLKAQLQELLAWVDRMKADGSLEEWARATGQAITAAFQSVRDFLVGTEEAPGFFQRLMAIFERISAVVSPLVNTFGGLETTVAALALVVGGPAITALFALTSAIAGLGAALLLTPVGWFALAIGVIAGLAYLIYENWGGIVAFFSDLWDRVSGAVSRFINSEQVQRMADIFGSIAQGIMDAWEPVGAFFSGLWDGIGRAFSAGWELIRPIVDLVVAGAERLASILPEWSTRDQGPTPRQRGAGNALRRQSIYGAPALGEGAAGQGALPPANDVRVRAGLDVNIRLPDGVQATVTQRGADDGMELSLLRGMMVTP